MPVEQLTYAQLAERRGLLKAARALVKRYRWPRSRGNDGKTLVAVDIDEIRHTPLPARSPGGHRPDVAALQARIASLEAELARHAATATGDQPALARMLAALEAHVETLKAANAKLETEVKRERARADGLNQDLDVAWRELALAKAEAATVPALKDTAEALKTALATSRDQNTEIRAERDRLLTREHLREQRRWYRRLVGG